MNPFEQLPQQPPVEIDVAFRALMYCRSVSDPQSLGTKSEESQTTYFGRDLTQLERGVESAALNLVRNWLNGETEFPRPPFEEVSEDRLLAPQDPFQGPWEDGREQQSNEEEAA